MHRILVVDDESPFRAVVRRALERWGYAVEEAADGREGVDAFIRTRVHLVILDLNLPRMAGVETIALIRDLDGDVPIIALSDPISFVIEDALVVGANVHLAKPFGVEELVAAVRALLARGSRGDAP